MNSNIKLETPVQNLEYSTSFANLTDKEKNYAYFMSKASWAGAKMCFNQSAYESPALFMIFQAYFQEKDFFKLETAASAAGVSTEEWKHFLSYIAGFYSNTGNYHSFGDNKFVPDLTPEKFKAILHSNPLYNNDSAFYRQVIDELLPQVETEIFAIAAPYNQLGFPHQAGVTAYFSRTMTAEDLKLIKEFLVEEKIDILITRAFKENGGFTITVGSVEANASREVEFKGHKFQIEYGEFSPFLEECNMYLTEANKYSANDTQRRMIEHYIESFRLGSVDAHKDSQREWVKDKGPVVETNIGYIESYVDPENSRAFFEGMVAIVDKEKSKKFADLVKNSETIIPMLPWEKRMEKEKFLAPDFTTLEVICFACNGCPLGINIPNYDDIREKEGFKNVYLDNAMGKVTTSNIQFATDEQAKVMADNLGRSYELHVGCHELLGHGTGRLIYRDADGKASTFTDPITKDEFESCYEEGDVWSTRFGEISCSYEECRADTVGFFLCTLPSVYSLFGFGDEDVKTLLWVNCMSQFRKGIIGLPLYNPEAKRWGQAHTQGAFVFAQWILKNQKSKIVEVVLDGEDNFLINLDKELLFSEGRDLIRDLLVVLQTYKSSGCLERGAKFYSEYSEVSDFYLQVREIVLRKKKPRRLDLNNNLVRYAETSIQPVVYPECHEGIILSFADRYNFNQQLYDQVIGQWNKHKDTLRVVPAKPKKAPKPLPDYYIKHAVCEKVAAEDQQEEVFEGEVDPEFNLDAFDNDDY